MEISKKTLQLIVQIQNATSKDEIRFGLSGVWYVGNKLYAACGYYGASIEVEESTKNPHIFFSNDDIKKIKFLLDQFKKLNPTFILERKTLSALGQSISLEMAEPEFIEISRVLDVDTEGKHVLSFNAEYLLTLAKAIGNNKSNRIVKLYIDTENKLAPIVVQSEHTGVLMPCRS